MKQKRLRNICRDILAHWYGKRRVDEEQTDIFYEGILDQLDDQEKETAKEYQELAGKLHEMWNYKDFEEMSEEEMFLCGGLLGGVKMLELAARRRDQHQAVSELVQVYEGKRWFLEAISNYPGIRHKDLAERGCQSPSQLSQFIVKAVKEGVVTYNRVGREKYYFLGKRGELVYEEIKKKQDSRQKDFTKLTFKNAMQLSNQSKSQQAVYADPGRLYGIPINGLRFGGERLYTNHAHAVHAEDPMWKAYVISGRGSEVLCKRVTKKDLLNV